ncbi:hypothetical protein VNI00_004685 [Paramarasmius palmivorus]|uniref:Uncharacterized protein n=1 Tax=Paramarasmius palmivorus TaxID=297713 RepID=A0AAW0DII1_9AGAR
MNFHHDSLLGQGARLSITVQTDVTVGGNDTEQGVVRPSLETRIHEREARNNKVEKLVEPSGAILEDLGTPLEVGISASSAGAKDVAAGGNDAELGVVWPSLEARICKRRVRNDKVEKLVEPTNAILEVLGTLSEANDIARAAFMVVSGIWQLDEGCQVSA